MTVWQTEAVRSMGMLSRQSMPCPLGWSLWCRGAQWKVWAVKSQAGAGEPQGGGMDAEIHPARLPTTPVSCLHCQATAQTRKFTRKAAKSNPVQELLR